MAEFIYQMYKARKAHGDKVILDDVTLSFYPESYRSTLAYLGKASGWDENKVEKSGLTPVLADGSVYFEEAALVFVCRKLSRTPLPAENFIDGDIDGKFYPDKDYHEMYIAEITDVLVP